MTIFELYTRKEKEWSQDPTYLRAPSGVQYIQKDDNGLIV